MIGNEEDFTASLGFEVKGVDTAISSIETDALGNAARQHRGCQADREVRQVF
jgi:hypothetical protein